jgi:hypothetical protein
MFAFPDVMYFFPNELSSLGGRRPAGALVLPCFLYRGFLGHNLLHTVGIDATRPPPRCERTAQPQARATALMPARLFQCTTAGEYA